MPGITTVLGMPLSHRHCNDIRPDTGIEERGYFDEIHVAR